MTRRCKFAFKKTKNIPGMGEQLSSFKRGASEKKKHGATPISRDFSMNLSLGVVENIEGCDIFDRGVLSSRATRYTCTFESNSKQKGVQY